MWHDGILYADPTRHEEENEGSKVHSLDSEGGQLTIGMMPTYANGQVALLVQCGQISADNLCEGLDAVVEISQRIYTLSRKVKIVIFCFNHSSSVSCLETPVPFTWGRSSVYSLEVHSHILSYVQTTL